MVKKVKEGGTMDHILTFQEWIEAFHSKDSDPNPYLLEEGYVFYLEKNLGTKLTVDQIKEIGEITLLMNEKIFIND